MKLFTVGPVACYPQVLEEMKRQMFSHRSEKYKTLHRETIALIQKFIETKNQVFLFSSTGTGFMEGSVRNCVEKKILCCINGSFGKRFSDVAISNGKSVEKLETTLGEPITPDLLDDKLSKAKIGDLVVIGGTGAYCSSMSTKNYNSYPEAPEVLIDQKGKFKLIKSRQTLKQMMNDLTFI